MLVDILSQDEKHMIDLYRRTYAGNSDGEWNEEFCVDVDQILTAWDNAKSEYLYKLFGNQLTISCPITYERDREELLEDMTDLSLYSKTFGREGHCGATFYHAFNEMTITSGFDSHTVSCLQSLFFDQCLVDNYYEGGPIDLVLPNGKIYKIRPGAKVMRILGKLAKAYDLPGFEDFRICHSLILNEKKLTGNLILSIHPLDYMTMSDNDAGWESCMNWMSCGQYRRGTVEMMNSPSVVVAYLTDNDFRIPGGVWNSKKWRCLLAINEKMGISIKGYPYINSYLAKEALAVLRELAEKNLGWEYDDFEKYEENSDEYCIYINEKQFFVGLDTGAMYSDLNSVPFHWIMLNREALSEDLDSPYPNICYTMPYSGIATCMSCGCEMEDFESGTEDYLLCEKCQKITHCVCCDEAISSDNIYWVNGNPYCESCYDYNVTHCDYCNEEYDIADMIAIYVIPRLSKEEQQKMRLKLDERYKENPWQFSFYEYEYVLNRHRYEPESLEVNYHIIDNQIVYICKDCFSKWMRERVKEGHSYHNRILGDSQPIKAIYFDELTNEAIEDIFDNEEEYRTGLIKPILSVQLQE